MPELFHDDDDIHDDVTSTFRGAAESLLQGTGYVHVDKQQAVSTAKRWLDGPFVVIDTETTGFHRPDQVIQIGIINQDGNTLLNTLIKPRTISIHNSQFHGITNEMVADAPTFPEVYPLIAAAVAGQRVVGYNLDFHLRMIDQDVQRHELPTIPWGDASRCLCVMELFAAFYGDS
ncbi:MAG: 3'-5' exonuclease, partial [Anaerolineae bacterium]|nr:3'-5' exonuclease [Anaerolineae bacterium]